MLDIDELVFSPPELGCVLYLPGHSGGGSKIYDRSPYGNPGAITGATWKCLPSGLWCLFYDGNDDSTNCGNGNSLNITDEITIELWFKTYGYWSGEGRITAKRSGDLGWQLNCGSSASRYIGFSWWNGSAWKAFWTENNVFNLDTWHHLVFTHKWGTTAKDAVFIDVVSQSFAQTGAADALASCASVDLHLGEGGGNYFKGYQALPRIYNWILPQFDIVNNFDREKHLFGVW